MSNLNKVSWSGLGKLVGSMCAVSGVLVLSLPIPIIAGNFEAFHKNQQKMTKAEKGKKKLKAAKIEEMETRQLYCNNKMTSCPSTRSPGKQNIYAYLLISISISTDIYNIKHLQILPPPRTIFWVWAGSTEPRMGSTRRTNTTPSSTADTGAQHTAIYAINCLLLKLQHGLREWILTELEKSVLVTANGTI